MPPKAKLTKCAHFTLHPRAKQSLVKSSISHSRPLLQYFSFRPNIYGHMHTHSHSLTHTQLILIVTLVYVWVKVTLNFSRKLNKLSIAVCHMRSGTFIQLATVAITPAVTLLFIKCIRQFVSIYLATASLRGYSLQ